jgi:hypothetical protein
METLNDLAFGLLSGLAYGLAGIVLLGLGFIALDLVTRASSATSSSTTATPTPRSWSRPGCSPSARS